ncbi:hypothetical protein POTOM_017773 [Populus tomentosa]|uniref:Uncharacterized protein n=1 Tax=Populus tomentosa TaxID=118781 RepID=A0A8X7ZY28_POPTO|nr:hypothetical protein POTOM_017773 [Populus tomentosa]
MAISQKSRRTPSNHSLEYVISMLLFGANGNRFDEQWENGVPKGNGVFTRPDGSCCIGSWNNSSKDLKGQQLNVTLYTFSIEFM